VRLGGIYALERLMQDSPRDQPTVVAVLCAFVRDESPSSVKEPGNLAAFRLPTDIQAALTVVGTRDTANDGLATVVDLDQTLLVHADLTSVQFSGANLSGANLTDAYLDGANLSGARLFLSKLTGAVLDRANLSGAKVSSANLTGAYIRH